MTSSKTPKLLDHEWQTLDDFAHDQVEKHPRTVQRWTKEPDGLPYAILGNTTYIHIPTAKDWMLARMRKPNPRRTSGRA